MGCGNSVEGKGDGGSAPTRSSKPAPAPKAAPKAADPAPAALSEETVALPANNETIISQPSAEAPAEEASVAEKSGDGDKPEEAKAPTAAVKLPVRPEGLMETNEPPNGEGLPGRLVNADVDTCALPEHLYYVFNQWPVLRHGLKIFLKGLLDQR